MKLILKIPVLIFLLVTVIDLSCKKETSCEGCTTINNSPPIAIAGPDQVITLPTDSISLNGNASNDPDGKISEWLWRKISGPASFIIVKPNDSITKVKNLVAGSYEFELKVIDNGGLSAKDTIKVIVDAVLTTNHPPIANAGVDQTISLPTNTINLDGSASTDPENNITSYLWEKISGPASFNITNPNAVQTQVTGLVTGAYLFELKVTDAGGLFSMDTIQVTVKPAINNNCILSQTFIGSLSIARNGVLIHPVGNKIVFAGGYTGGTSFVPSSRVDIYDRSSQSWSTAELSHSRNSMGAITSGTKVYFAGGGVSTGSVISSRIDIYDASSNSWSTAELSEPRSHVLAVAAGNKVLFAGGTLSTGGWSKKVDIYDQSDGSWSIATLSHPITNSPGLTAVAPVAVISYGNKIYISTSRNNIDIYDAQTNTWSNHTVSPNQLTFGSAVVLDNKIYFSGSDSSNITPEYVYANTLEVYEIPSNSWSSVSMASSRAYMRAIAGDGKIFWAGGIDSAWTFISEERVRPLNNIEMYDVNTGLHSFHECQQKGYWFTWTLKTNNKIFFSYDNYTEIYDMSNHTWTLCSIFLYPALVIDNAVYLLGSDSRIWKLEF